MSKPSTPLNSYQPQNFESKWVQHWETIHLGAPKGQGRPFTILIPPPNVTGSLHMGHGFQLSLMDAVVRYRRMRGDDVRWVVGTDHAGIATQMVVERELDTRGTSSKILGRDAFIDEVWQWKHFSGDRITTQMRRLGISVDWDHERFTMDEDYSKQVRETFVELHRRGILYRGKRLVHWDTVLQTAVSDLEVENKTVEGSLWTIAYAIENGDRIMISTTRPETMFGDVAIAVHPEDTRFKKWIGKQAKIPYTERWIPIIADEYVDPEFGTGAVKITPAHDVNDYAVAVRHHLPTLNIMEKDGRLNDEVPEAYRGLDRFEARKKLLSALAEGGYLISEQSHTLNIPLGDRSQSVLEPRLTSQWFMKTECLAALALEAAERQQTELLPSYWLNSYRRWLEAPQDWCLSRQLWWGHRIPAWYDREGQVYVGRSEHEVREYYRLDDRPLEQDEDVLDTWFSAALWPMVTLGHHQDPEAFAHRYPTNLLVTGFDILFFWVARMSMMSLELTQTPPFRQVLITGLIRDSQGQKMSKSKGNILDPLHLIDGVSLESLLESRTRGLMQPKMKDSIQRATEKEYPHGIESHGADALRLTFCALFNTGQDIRFDVRRLVGFRNFCNKLWNAAKLIEHRLQTQQPTQLNEHSIYTAWIEKKWQESLGRLEHAFEHYRFDLIAQELQDWAWHHFCDWYCEMAKILMDREPESSPTLYSLLRLLDQFLLAAHPVMPFITEELGQFTALHLGLQRAELATNPYPQIEAIETDTTLVDQLCDMIAQVRRVRSMLQISPQKRLKIYLNVSADFQNFLKAEMDMVKRLGKIESLHFDAAPSRSASALIAAGHIAICIADLDITRESERLQKQIRKLTQEIQRVLEKVQQPLYREKAPHEIQMEDHALLKQRKAELASFETLLQEMNA